MMQIKLNDLIFTTELKPGIQGLTKPKIRTTQANYSGKDGGYVSGQFYAPREIVIPLNVRGSTCAALEERMAQIIDLPIREDIDMFVTSFSGVTRYATVRVIDIDDDITGRFLAEPVITLVAPDPYFYDAGDGSDPDSGFIEQDIYKVVGGGYVTPYILPVEWEPGATPSVVTNAGDITVYPQIVLEDQWTNPIITNTTTGLSVQINVSTTGGDVLIIDMKNQTVTLNGGNILPLRDSSSSWWGLIPGDNTIAITSDSGTDASIGVIRYRQGYLSIYES